MKPVIISYYENMFLKNASADANQEFKKPCQTIKRKSAAKLYMNYNKLNPQEERVIVHKATETPFTGEYESFYKDGTYICRRCNAPLFSSKSKFDAGCGWPSFDESFPNALKRVPDPDGVRIEIQCKNCGGHLGHEFLGEGLTDKDTRECVNSLSIRFIPKGKELPKIITYE